MSDRARLLVAHLLHGEDAAEVDAFRRVFQSNELRRIAPHITLLPPQNLGVERLEEVVDALSTSLSTVEPFGVALEGIATFPPLHHVLYLPVTRGVADLEDLRERCSTGGLMKVDVRAFVPHVTVKSHAQGDLVEHATVLCSSFHRSIRVASAALLRQEVDAANRPWRVIDEFALGSALTIGRGEFEVTCTRSTTVTERDRSFLADNGVASFDEDLGGESRDRDCIVIRARRRSSAVGLTVIRPFGRFGEIDCIVVDMAHRNEGVGRHMLGYLERCADELGLEVLLGRFDRSSRGFFERNGFSVSGADTADRPTWVVRQTRLR